MRGARLALTAALVVPHLESDEFTGGPTGSLSGTRMQKDAHSPDGVKRQISSTRRRENISSVGKLFQQTKLDTVYLFWGRRLDEKAQSCAKQKWFK